MFIIFFSSDCSMPQWEETEKIEKHETAPTDYQTWIEESFVHSFLDWIRGKITSRIPVEARTAYEMIIPISSSRGATHIDVILYKGFPLPSYASRM